MPEDKSSNSTLVISVLVVHLARVHHVENRFPAWTYFNHWRPEQFKEAFAKHLQILRFQGVGINHDPESQKVNAFSQKK